MFSSPAKFTVKLKRMEHNLEITNLKLTKFLI